MIFERSVTPVILSLFWFGAALFGFWCCLYACWMFLEQIYKLIRH